MFICTFYKRNDFIDRLFRLSCLSIVDAKYCIIMFVRIDGLDWLHFFELPSVCLCIFSVSIVGIIMEERVAVKLILLFEICTASVIGYAVSIVPIVGVASVVLSVIFLIVAAVESILLFGFIVLLHYLCQASDLSRLKYLQS